MGRKHTHTHTCIHIIYIYTIYTFSTPKQDAVANVRLSSLSTGDTKYGNDDCYSKLKSKSKSKKSSSKIKMKVEVGNIRRSMANSQ